MLLLLFLNNWADYTQLNVFVRNSWLETDFLLVIKLTIPLPGVLATGDLYELIPLVQFQISHAEMGGGEKMEPNFIPQKRLICM